MKISGFSMVKNADKLYYPIKAVIQSVLPLVDEFVIAVGDGDKDDRTREMIQGIGSEKIHIIDTVWDLEKYPRGMENAHQTDIAKSHCSGDWLLYLQADEVIHEKYLPVIEQGCRKHLEDKEVEGMLLKYVHFWGDYYHYHTGHSWYKKEIRIIRNREDIHSWESAQSFRRIPEFDGLNYRRQQGTFKLKVKELDAWVYHYGWVRPPHLMKNKTQALAGIHKGTQERKVLEIPGRAQFDYGPLNLLKEFKGSHPEVMRHWIAKFDWKDQLQYGGLPNANRPKHKHEKLKNRVFTWIKHNIPGMTEAGDFKNYILLK
ncbi:MAG: glycosyltransferase family 2 protein [Bacteroidales bacterium]